MKNLKQIILPAVIIFMGTGAALATNQAKNDKSTLVDGYRIDPNTSQCIEIKKECSTIGDITCTWSDGTSEHVLYELGETMCNNPLFEP